MQNITAGIDSRRARAKPRPACQGTVLVITLIVMIVLTILTAGLWSLRTADGTAAARSVTSLEAFWAAEAGVHDALLRLNFSTNYYASPTNFTGTITNGRYAVSVTNTSPTNFLIISTGTVGSSYRIVRQTTLVAAQGNFALSNAISGFSGNGNEYNNAVIRGDVYEAGNMNIYNNAKVIGIVYDDSVSGNGTYTNQPPPDPPPTMPVLDTSYYDTQLANAALAGAGNKSYSTLNLAGGTTYVNGNMTLNGNITGPGVLVATGSITANNNVTIGSNVTLIAGTTLSLYNNVNVKAGAVLYATSGVNVSNNGIVMTGAEILTLGNVNANNNINFSGLIYAGGTFVLGNNATVNGSVVAGGSITIENNAQVNFNPNAFSTIPAGLGGQVSIGKLSWSEH